MTICAFSLKVHAYIGTLACRLYDRPLHHGAAAAMADLNKDDDETEKLERFQKVASRIDKFPVCMVAKTYD